MKISYTKLLADVLAKCKSSSDSKPQLQNIICDCQEPDAIQWGIATDGRALFVADIDGYISREKENQTAIIFDKERGEFVPTRQIVNYPDFWQVINCEFNAWLQHGEKLLNVIDFTPYISNRTIDEVAAKIYTLVCLKTNGKCSLEMGYLKAVAPLLLFAKFVYINIDEKFGTTHIAIISPDNKKSLLLIMAKREVETMAEFFSKDTNMQNYDNDINYALEKVNEAIPNADIKALRNQVVFVSSVEKFKGMALAFFKEDYAGIAQMHEWLQGGGSSAAGE